MEIQFVNVDAMRFDIRGHFLNGDLKRALPPRTWNLIREFMTRAKDPERRDSEEAMKAHCRIKKSGELTARAGAIC